MPTFRYLAKRGPQDAIEGVLEADNRADVLARLTGLGYTPVRITEAQAESQPIPTASVTFKGRVPLRHLNAFTRQFASLVRSQVPLLRALSILKEQTSHPRLQQIIGAISEDIRQGQTLSGSLRKYPQVFSPLYVSLTHSGEIAGTLDTVLDRLASQADRDEALRSKVQAALVYPMFVGMVGLGTVVFLLAFVMPRLIKLFQGFGGRLPLPTRLLLLISGWMSQGWFWATGLALVIVLLMVLKNREKKTRVLLDRLLLKVPFLGSLIRDLELTRFARSFGLLLHHGIPILQATEVAIPVIRHRVFRQEVERLPAALKEGLPLATCLKGLSIATPFLVHTVAVGEEGGRADEALTEVANYYEQEAERLLHVVAALLEPMIILAVGIMVGFIVMAVLLPIFEMSVIAR